MESRGTRYHMIKSVHTPVVWKHIRVWSCEIQLEGSTFLHRSCSVYFLDRDTLKCGPGGMRQLTGWSLGARTGGLQSDCTQHPQGRPLYSDGFIPGRSPRNKELIFFSGGPLSFLYMQVERKLGSSYAFTAHTLLRVEEAGTQPGPPASTHQPTQT